MDGGHSAWVFKALGGDEVDDYVTYNFVEVKMRAWHNGLCMHRPLSAVCCVVQEAGAWGAYKSYPERHKAKNSKLKATKEWCYKIHPNGVDPTDTDDLMRVSLERLG